MQVTRSAIGRTVGATTPLRQKLHKMPLTAQVIAGVVETRVEYAVRRIWWAAECFTHDRVMPRPWQLVIRANVYTLEDVAEIRAVIQTALSSIESELALEEKLSA